MISMLLFVAYIHFAKQPGLLITIVGGTTFTDKIISSTFFPPLYFGVHCQNNLIYPMKIRIAAGPLPPLEW